MILQVIMTFERCLTHRQVAACATALSVRVSRPSVEGFPSEADRERAISSFATVEHQSILTSDDTFDIGAYAKATTQKTQ
jgi:hypothetical protein